MILLMLVCSCDIKTNVFLQASRVTVLYGKNMWKEESLQGKHSIHFLYLNNQAFKESKKKHVDVGDVDDVKRTRTRTSLNKKAQLTTERADRDLNSTKKNLF